MAFKSQYKYIARYYFRYLIACTWLTAVTNSHASEIFRWYLIRSVVRFQASNRTCLWVQQSIDAVAQQLQETEEYMTEFEQSPVFTNVLVWHWAQHQSFFIMFSSASTITQQPKWNTHTQNIYVFIQFTQQFGRKHYLWSQNEKINSVRKIRKTFSHKAVKMFTLFAMNEKIKQ